MAGLGRADGLHEQFAGELVTAFGQAQIDLAGGPSVHLGRATGAGSASAGRAPVLEGQKTVLHQAVEMKLGHMALDPDAGRRLVAAHGIRGSGHEPVQGTPDGIAEGGRSVELGVEVWAIHFG